MGKSKICNACGKPVQPDDKFCPHCGAAVETGTLLPKQKNINPTDKIPATSYFLWIFIALFTGIIFGWVRYWIGYYILIQGVIAGLLIVWMVKKSAAKQLEALAEKRFKVAIFLFLSFLLAQAVGFGMAQPVFDPFNWFIRVWNGDTTESVFGIFATGGVVSHTFSEGLKGGFWVFLWLIDLFFMFFLMLVSMPLTSKKKSHG